MIFRMSQEQGIDTLAIEHGKLKQQLEELKTEMKQNETILDETDKENLHSVEEFIEHYNECNKDDCEIHSAKEKDIKQWFLKGILQGKKLSKR